MEQYLNKKKNRYEFKAETRSLSLQNVFRMFNIHIRFSYEYKRTASQYGIKENLMEYVEWGYEK